MSENSGQQQLLVKARFNFQQTNEDELTFAKGDIIGVTRQEDGGWWEGTLNGKTGWFPSNYVRELKGSGRWTCRRPLLCQSLVSDIIDCKSLMHFCPGLQTNRCHPSPAL